MIPGFDKNIDYKGTTDYIEKFIPSKTVKDYIRKNNLSIAPEDMATIIWNSNEPLDVRHACIKDLKRGIAGEDILKQIDERIAYDIKALETICSNNGEFCYVPVYEDDGEELCLGHFAEVDLAFKKCLGLNEKFTIYKYQIISSNSKPIKLRSFSNPLLQPDINKQVEEMENKDDWPVSGMRFNDKGLLMSYWTNETPLTEAHRIECFEPKRFEYKFTPVPNPFEKDDTVIYTADGTKFTVVTTQEYWNVLVQNAKNNDYIADYSESTILLRPLDFQPHEHINPIFLEKLEL